MQVFCQLTDLFCYLNGQLSGRTKHHRLWFFMFRIDLLQQRNAKRGSLTSTGLCLPNHIPTFHLQRNRLGLDGRCLFKSHITDCPQDLFLQIHILKSHCFHLILDSNIFFIISYLPFPPLSFHTIVNFFKNKNHVFKGTKYPLYQFSSVSSISFQSFSRHWNFLLHGTFHFEAILFPSYTPLSNPALFSKKTSISFSCISHIPLL